jgi:hypothetical protein
VICSAAICFPETKRGQSIQDGRKHDKRSEPGMFVQFSAVLCLKRMPNDANVSDVYRTFSAMMADMFDCCQDVSITLDDELVTFRETLDVRPDGIWCTL